jgi:hypothetical protein
MHVVVNRVDPRHRGQSFSLGTKAQLQHRFQGPVKAPGAAPPFGAERAVVGNTACDERMRELKQDRRASGEKEDNLALKHPGRCARAGRCVTRADWGEPRADHLAWEIPWQVARADDAAFHRVSLFWILQPSFTFAE